MSTLSEYFFITKCLLTFIVGPISPPGIEKSVGRIVHFCIFCAFEFALLLYRSMPAWMASITMVSGPRSTSSRVSAFDPCSLHQSCVSRSSLDFGSRVSLSTLELVCFYLLYIFTRLTSTLRVTRQERNFLWSPIRTTWDRQGSSFFTWINSFHHF